MEIEKKQKTKRSIILIILLLIVLVLGGFYIYFMTDLFKTPEQLFKKYLMNNAFQLTKTNIKPFDEIITRTDLEPVEYNINTVYKMESFLKKEEVNINLKSNLDKKNNNESLKILLKKGDNTYFEGTIAITDQMLGIRVPEIYGKYIALENKDLKKFAENLGVTGEDLEKIPESVPNSALNTTYFSEEEIAIVESLKNKYFSKITSLIDENNYMAEKKIKITVDNNDIVTNKYTLKIDAEKMYNTITTSIKELLEDPDFLTLCNGRIDSKLLEEYKNSYNNWLENTKIKGIENETFQISVFVANRKTVKTEIAMAENKVAMLIDNNENESKITFVVNKPKTETNEVAVTNTAIIRNDFKDEAGEISYEMITEYNKDDVNALIEKQKKEQEKNNFVSVLSSLYNYYMDEENNTALDLPDYTDYNEKYKKQSAKFIIKTQKNDENTYTSEIVLEGEIFENINNTISETAIKCEFGNENVEKITSHNSIVVNDYKLTDFEKLLSEITENINKTAESEKDTLVTNLYKGFEYFNSTLDMIPDFEESVRQTVYSRISTAVNECLTNYRNELSVNLDANVADFLTIENIQKECEDRFKVELIDGTTIKCTTENGDSPLIHYAVIELINVNEKIIQFKGIEVFTEEEFLNR